MERLRPWPRRGTLWAGPEFADGRREVAIGTFIAIAALVVAVVLGIWFIGLAFQLVVTLVAGLLIGVVARAILPGEQPMGLLATTAAGVAGSMVGGLLARSIFGISGLLGRTAVSVACAVVVIAVFAPQLRQLPGGDDKA